MEFIFEATGIATLEFDLMDALAEGGAYVLTGIPGGDRPTQVPAATLIREFVLANKVMLGSVNAAARPLPDGCRRPGRRPSSSGATTSRS